MPVWSPGECGSSERRDTNQNKPEESEAGCGSCILVSSVTRWANIDQVSEGLDDRP